MSDDNIIMALAKDDECCEGNVSTSDILIVDITFLNPLDNPDWNCLSIGQIPCAWDPIDERWEGVGTDTGEPGCEYVDVYVYCTGNTVDDWFIQFIMNGSDIYQDAPNPGATCDPLFIQFSDTGIAITMTKS